MGGLKNDSPSLLSIPFPSSRNFRMKRSRFGKIIMGRSSSVPRHSELIKLGAAGAGKSGKIGVSGVFPPGLPHSISTYNDTALRYGADDFHIRTGKYKYEITGSWRPGVAAEIAKGSFDFFFYNRGRRVVQPRPIAGAVRAQ